MSILRCENIVNTILNNKGILQVDKRSLGFLNISDVTLGQTMLAFSTRIFRLREIEGDQ
jgi:hypothetical protein